MLSAFKVNNNVIRTTSIDVVMVFFMGVLKDTKYNMRHLLFLLLTLNIHLRAKIILS